MSDTPQNYNKAYASGLTGSLSLIIAWIWNTFIPEHPMPAEVAIAMSTFLSTLAVFFTPHGQSGDTQ